MLSDVIRRLALLGKPTLTVLLGLDVLSDAVVVKEDQWTLDQWNWTTPAPSQHMAMLSQLIVTNIFALVQNTCKAQ